LWKLRDRSLLASHVTPGGQSRFSMLVTIRQYAATKLDDSARAAVELRAGEYFAEFVAHWGAQAEGDAGASALRHLELEVDNIVALQASVVALAPAVAVELGLGIQPLLACWGPHDLRRPTLDLAVEAAQKLGPSERARALVARLHASRQLGQVEQAHDDLARLDALSPKNQPAGLQAELRLVDVSMAHDRGDMAAAASGYDEVIALARTAMRRDVEADALVLLARLHTQSGQSEPAYQRNREALEIYEEIGLRAREAEVLDVMGWSCIDAERLDEADALLKKALARCRERDDGRLEGAVRDSMAFLCMERGELAAARIHFERAIALKRKIGDRRGEGNSLGSLGLVELEARNFDAARRHLDGACVVFREVGNSRKEAGAGLSRAVAVVHQGDVEAARDAIAQRRAELIEKAGGWGSHATAALEATVELVATRGCEEEYEASVARAQETLQELCNQPESNAFLRHAVRVLQAELH